MGNIFDVPQHQVILLNSSVRFHVCPRFKTGAVPQFSTPPMHFLEHEIRKSALFLEPREYIFRQIKAQSDIKWCLDFIAWRKFIRITGLMKYCPFHKIVHNLYSKSTYLRVQVHARIDLNTLSPLRKSRPP